MHELYQGAYTPFEWDEPLKKFAEGLGLFFSAPFDTTAVDLLQSLDVGLYKIASYEATDHVLLERVAATGKPVVMSTGYTSMEELDESVKLLRDKGVKDLALLHCITYYTEALEPRLAFMETMLHSAIATMWLAVFRITTMASRCQLSRWRWAHP